MSTIGEFIPIPGIEINQLLILCMAPFYFLKAKKRYRYYPFNLIVMVLVFLYVYIFFQGATLAFDFIEFIKTAKNYAVAFIFISMVIVLDIDEFRLILRRYVNFSSVFFLIEYTLGYFNIDGIYNLLFNPPFANIRNVANFLSPNSYGIILSILIVGNLYLFFNESKKYYFVFAMLLVLPLLTTASRSGLIILVSGIFIYVFIRFRLPIKILAILTVIFGVYSFFSERLLSFLYQHTSSYFVRRFILYLESGNLFGDRMNEYNLIFNAYSDSWFVGLGFGNITGSNEIYTGMSSMHNEYFRFFIEAGIVGGILFFLLISILLYAMVKVIKSKNVDRDTKALFVTYSAMFLIAEMQYNFFDAHREGIILIFIGFSSIMYFSRKFKDVHKKVNNPRSCELINNKREDGVII
ncbi:O-antigen ligase family protein [Senegalia massiliensis]|uniref:O-antigen ligase family protein n=1 Tax=Senegalia massiliensis TaxID=1720316 RepID=UPI0013EF417C|nr:O-antigen ligase family protein [Senegalia massiliensis]